MIELPPKRGDRDGQKPQRQSCPPLVQNRLLRCALTDVQGDGAGALTGGGGIGDWEAHWGQLVRRGEEYSFGNRNARFTPMLQRLGERKAYALN